MFASPNIFRFMPTLLKTFHAVLRSVLGLLPLLLGLPRTKLRLKPVWFGASRMTERISNIEQGIKNTEEKDVG